MVYVLWFMRCGLCAVYALWFMLCGLCAVVYALWFMRCGLCAVVYVLRFMRGLCALIRNAVMLLLHQVTRNVATSPGAR